MADFNPNTPAVRGMEWRPSSGRLWRGDSTGRGIAMRIRPGAATFANIDAYINKVVGSPGFAVELLADNPTVPGTPPLYTLTGADAAAVSGGATGSSFTGWQNQAGGAAAFSDVSDGSLATYQRNQASTPIGTPIYSQVAGNLVTTAPINRTAYVYVTAKVQTLSIAAAVRLFITVGGTRYFSGYYGVTVQNGVRDLIYQWPVDPSTNRPWTYDTVDTFWSGSTQPWGIEMQGIYASTLPAASFRFYETALGNNQASSENRMAAFYSSNIGLANGVGAWLEKALTAYAGMGGLSTIANQWYWLHIYPWQNADGANSFTIPVLKASNPPTPAANATSTTGEHRTVYETVIGPGGTIVGYAAATTGEMIPALLETTAPAILSQSQPYTSVNTVTLANGVNTNAGEHVTTAAATTYAGIRLVLGWQNRSIAPDAPLTIELRHGAGAETGGGTLDGSITVTSQDLTRNVDGTVSLQDFLAKFVTPLALLATTQYTVRFTTTATNGRGWQYAYLPTSSGARNTGVALADVQGATQGGTTDQRIASGAGDNDSDLPLALVSPPTGPASLTLAAVAAT